MSMLEQAATWLENQRQAHLSVPAVYIGRNRQTAIMVAVGKTLFRAEDEYGVTIRIESCDFLVSVKELPEEPQRGDQIHYKGQCYEVLAPNNEPCWRWCNGTQITRRIHTKQIGGIDG